MARQAAEAEALFRRILGVAPTNAVALNSLAVILLESGRYQEALRLVIAGTEANPDLAQIWFILGPGILGEFRMVAISTTGYSEALCHSFLWPDRTPLSFKKPIEVDCVRRAFTTVRNSRSCLGLCGVALSHRGESDGLT